MSQLKSSEMKITLQEIIPGAQEIISFHSISGNHFLRILVYSRVSSYTLPILSHKIQSVCQEQSWLHGWGGVNTWCLHALFPHDLIVTSSQFLQPCLAAGEFLNQVASNQTLGVSPSSKRSHLWEFGIWNLGAGANSALLPNVCFECLVGSWSRRRSKLSRSQMASKCQNHVSL